MNHNIKEKTLFDFNNDKDIYAFLNMSARDFYKKGIYVCEKSDFCNYIKGCILVVMVEIERIINSISMSGFDLSNTDSNQLKAFFPNACTIFGVDKEEGLLKMGTFLTHARNISAHSMPVEDDYEMFDADYSQLSTQPRINKSVVYLTDNNELTFAGLIFIIINFIREKSLSLFLRADKTIAHILLDENGNSDCDYFVKTISRVNLEIPIRCSKGETIISSILGNFYQGEDCTSFDIILGDNDTTDFNVHGSVDGNNILIKSGSLTRVYYPEDYCLSIEDVESFINYSNQLPPFAFIDLLYKLGVNKYTLETKELIQEKWNLYSKLGYPKFYIDKNIDILLLDYTVSDYRVVSNTVSSSVMTLMMRLEKTLFMVFDLDISKHSYSKISSLLNRIDAPNNIVKNVTALRNFAVHGYIFGESFYAFDEVYQYSFEFVLKTLYDLLMFLKKKKNNAYEYTSRDVAHLFINRIIALKTNNAIKDSLKLLNDYPAVTNQKDLHVKNEFINRSIYDFKVLSKLNHLAGQGTRLFAVEIDGLDDKLYLRHGEKEKELLNDFCYKNHFTIEVIDKDGVVEYIRLTPIVN